MGTKSYDAVVAICYEDGRWERKEFFGIPVYFESSDYEADESMVMDEVEGLVAAQESKKTVVAIGMIEWGATDGGPDEPVIFGDEWSEL